MPCNDGGWPQDEVRVSQETYSSLRDIEAMLCGIAGVLERDELLSGVLDAVNWKEVGVSKRKFFSWWSTHKLEDAARKAREQGERDRANLIKKALAKLTDEERDLLGISLK